MSNSGQSAIDGIPSRHRALSNAEKNDAENYQLKKRLTSTSDAEQRRRKASERQKLLDERQKLDRLKNYDDLFLAERYAETKARKATLEKRLVKTSETSATATILDDAAQKYVKTKKAKQNAEPAEDSGKNYNQFNANPEYADDEDFDFLDNYSSNRHASETDLDLLDNYLSESDDHLSDTHETTIDPDDPEYENPAILNALRRQESIRNGYGPTDWNVKESGGIEVGVPVDDEEEKTPKKLKNKLSKKKKIAIAVASVLVVFVGSLALWGQGLLSKITGGNADLLSLLTSAFSQDVELNKGKNGRTNVLVFGTSGYDMSGSGHDGYQLTDSIMIISLEQSSGDVAMVNIPRDLYVGNTCSNTGKINEVYHCANSGDTDEIAGKDALAATVETVTNVDTQYYVHVDWGALVQVVDSIGGITVTLDEDIDDTWTNTHIKAGVATNLNGEQALGLARARHGTEQGDLSRGNSQQKILIALQQKLLGGNISIAEATSLLNTLGDNVRTDFNSNELVTIFHLASNMKTTNLRQVPLVTDDFAYVKSTSMNVDGTEVSFVIPALGSGDFSAIKKYIARSFSSDPAVREEAKIVILNGASVQGLASDEKSILESAGYEISNIGDAPDGVYPEKYYLYDLTNEKPATKTALENRYSTTAKTADLLPNDISARGADFVLILGARPDLQTQEVEDAQ